MSGLKVYRFVNGARSHYYMHDADVVLDDKNNLIKHCFRAPIGPATQDEIDACVDITPKMTKHNLSRRDL